MNALKLFNIYTLGCKVNQYDANKIAEKLVLFGLQKVKENADLSIIHTCCVTKTAIVKNKRIINKAQKDNPKSKIIITGCWPKAYKNDLKDKNIEFIKDIKKLDKIIEKYKLVINPNQILNSNKVADQNLSPNSYLPTSNRSRYFIKIQDGCEQFCTYCVIPYARGKLRSRPQNEVLSEIKQAVKGGYREIVICGVHLGLYQEEAEYKKRKRGKIGGFELVKLLKQIIKIKDLGRVRLSSIEVTEVNDELIKLISSTKKICQHLHISLQSGCNKILKKMNRPYTKEFYKKRVVALRNAMPNIAITTDVIVGFPGENDADFEKTYQFIKEIAFSKLHVFSFSAHEKTAAYHLPDKISQDIIKKRSEKLRKLSKVLEVNYRKKFIGKELEVVVLEKDKNGKYKGKTEFYFDAEVSPKSAKSKVHKILLTL